MRLASPVPCSFTTSAFLVVSEAAEDEGGVLDLQLIFSHCQQLNGYQMHLGHACQRILGEMRSIVSSAAGAAQQVCLQKEARQYKTSKTINRPEYPRPPYSYFVCVLIEDCVRHI